jgi:hypothetical protein
LTEVEPPLKTSFTFLISATSAPTPKLAPISTYASLTPETAFKISSLIFFA